VRYVFVGRSLAEHSEIFRLDADTGIVTIRRPLDFEVRQFYRLFIAASDLGDVYGGARMTSHALVEITVIDINDNAPVICLQQASVANQTGSSQGNPAVVGFASKTVLCLIA